MITIEEASWDAPEYDTCGNTTFAIMRVNGMIIPLCEDCLKELTGEIEAYNNKIHCYQCKHFVCSNSGLRYGGSCKLQAEDMGKIITKENAGYDFSHDFNDSCKRAERSE